MKHEFERILGRGIILCYHSVHIGQKIHPKPLPVVHVEVDRMTLLPVQEVLYSFNLQVHVLAGSSL